MPGGRTNVARATASVKTAKLQPEGIEPYAFFAGGGVAVIDETAVIGGWNQPCEGVQFDQEVHDMFYDDYADWAHDYNDPDRKALGLGCGLAFVYVRDDGGNWMEEAVLTTNEPVVGDQLGSRTAINGDTAIVAAQGNQGDRGAAHVFVCEYLPNGAAQWRQQAKLVHSYGNAGNKFAGWEALTISGDTAVVGSANEGLAHIYQRADVVWFEQATLSPVGGAAANETFGTSASIIDNVAVIGSVNELRAPIPTGASVSPTSMIDRSGIRVPTQLRSVDTSRHPRATSERASRRPVRARRHPFTLRHGDCQCRLGRHRQGRNPGGRPRRGGHL